MPAFMKVEDIKGEATSSDSFEFDLTAGESRDTTTHIEVLTLNYTKVESSYDEVGASEDAFIFEDGRDADARIEVRLPDVLVSSYQVSGCMDQNGAFDFGF